MERSSSSQEALQVGQIVKTATQEYCLTGLGIGLSLTKQAAELGANVLVADLRSTPEFDSYAQGESRKRRN